MSAIQYALSFYIRLLLELDHGTILGLSLI